MKSGGLLLRKKRYAFGIACLVVITGFLSVMTFESEVVSAANQTLYVGGTGPGNYTFIQDAIDAASNGDMIFVYNNVYFENIAIYKEINLIGENREKTLIHSDHIGNAVTITKDDVKISGFSVKHGVKGIRLLSSSNIEISNNIISYHTDGISIELNSNNNLIKDNIISNNRWGICIDQSSKNNISKNNVSNNYYLGIQISSSLKNYVTQNVIENDRDNIWLWGSCSKNEIKNNQILTYNGTGVILWDASNNSITGNNITATKYEGVHLLESSYNTIKYNSLLDCESGILIESSNCNIMASNYLFDNMDGILVKSSERNVIKNNNLLNNRLGVELQGSIKNWVYHNNFYDNYNQAYDRSSANYWNESYPIGGNYWAEFSPNNSDLFHGEDTPQTSEGTDGICDNEYFVSGGSRDYYPLKYPWVTSIAPPTAPIDVDAQTGISYINLTWNKPEWAGGQTVRFYKIYKGMSPDEETYYTGIEDMLFFNDTNVINGNIYYYKITALNIAGESPFSIEISAMPGKIPSAPQNISVIPGDSYITLTWDAPFSDGGAPIINYTIFRNTTVNNSELFIRINNGTFYNDTEVTNDINYYYSLSAWNCIGESELSEVVSATPFRNDPPTCEIITPSSGDTISGTYRIYGTAFDPDTKIEYVEIKIGSNRWTYVTGTNNWEYYWDTTEVRNRQYVIYVRAYDGLNYSIEDYVCVNVENEDPPKPPIYAEPWFWGILLTIIIFMCAFFYIIIKDSSNRTPPPPR